MIEKCLYDVDLLAELAVLADLCLEFFYVSFYEFLECYLACLLFVQCGYLLVINDYMQSMVIVLGIIQN